MASDSDYKIIFNKNNKIVRDQKNIFPANSPFLYRNIWLYASKLKKFWLFGNSYIN
jgi:hypothetical protein